MVTKITVKVCFLANVKTRPVIISMVAKISGLVFTVTKMTEFNHLLSTATKMVTVFIFPRFPNGHCFHDNQRNHRQPMNVGNNYFIDFWLQHSTNIKLSIKYLLKGFMISAKKKLMIFLLNTLRSGCLNPRQHKPICDFKIRI